MTTGTITLKATFPNDDRALWPGAFVDVVVRLDTEAGVTVVPTSAITMGQKGPQIFVVKADGSADLRSVTVERTVGQESVISKGVEPGEQVVTNGQLRLVPGAKVLVKPTEGEPAKMDQKAASGAAAAIWKPKLATSTNGRIPIPLIWSNSVNSVLKTATELRNFSKLTEWIHGHPDAPRRVIVPARP